MKKHLLLGLVLVLLILAAGFPMKTMAAGVSETAQSVKTEAETKKQTEKPAIVKSLKAKGENTKKACVVLSWKSADAEKYEIVRSSEKNGTYKNIATVKKNQYKDVGVKAGKNYYYKVRAVTGSKKGEWSKAEKGAVPIKGVKNVKIIRYSTTSLKIQWSAQAKAKYYKVYRAASKGGKYKLLTTTKRLYYRDKGLKNGKRYYYKVKACVVKKDSGRDSALSKAVSMKTKTYSRTTVLAGDSIMTGMGSTGGLKAMDIGGNKKVYAGIGLGTLTYQNKKMFDGKTGLEKVIGSNPYRVYIMLGMNEVSYRNQDTMISDYKKMIKAIQKKCPNTDIVLLAVSPLSKAALAKTPNFKRIPGFNSRLKTLAKQCGVKYYDYTAAFKDSQGYLKYNGGDGIHWNVSGYKEFGRLLAEYDKKQD